MPDSTTENPSARGKPEKPKIESAAEKVRTEKQLERFARESDISHRGTVVEAWKRQQEQDRKTRGYYASCLMWVMVGQIIAINIAFFLMGLGYLKIPDGTAKTFIITTFVEISALVLTVTKYLFPPSSDRILDLIQDARQEARSRVSRATHPTDGPRKRTREKSPRPK